MEHILPYMSFHFRSASDENQGADFVSPFASGGPSGLWCLPIPEVHPKQGQSGSTHLRAFDDDISQIIPLLRIKPPYFNTPSVHFYFNRF